MLIYVSIINSPLSSAEPWNLAVVIRSDELDTLDVLSLKERVLSLTGLNSDSDSSDTRRYDPAVCRLFCMLKTMAFEFPNKTRLLDLVEEQDLRDMALSMELRSSERAVANNNERSEHSILDDIKQEEEEDVKQEEEEVVSSGIVNQQSINEVIVKKEKKHNNRDYKQDLLTNVSVVFGPVGFNNRFNNNLLEMTQDLSGKPTMETLNATNYRFHSSEFLVDDESVDVVSSSSRGKSSMKKSKRKNSGDTDIDGVVDVKKKKSKSKKK